MTSSYYYSISLDFPTYFNQSQLASEITASAISSAVFLAILVDGDGVEIIFDGPLSVGDVTILNTVVANHAPIPNQPPPAQSAPPLEPDAVAPPSTSNDGSNGFTIGSVWVDTVTKVAYVCTDATTGAAVWKPITSSMSNVGSGAGEIYKDVTSAGVFELKTVLSAANSGIAVTDNVSDVSISLDIPNLSPIIAVDPNADYVAFYSVGDAGPRKIHPVDLFASIPKSNSTAGAPTVSDDETAGYANGSIWVDTATSIAYVLVDATSGAAVWKEASVELTSSAPANVDKSSAAVGSSLYAAKADHKHDVATAAAVTVGTANAEGTSSSLARADHVHSHGSQTTPTHHALATTSAHGFLSSGDKTKLDFSNAIQNQLIVQLNPGAGEFSSINAALATITTNSSSNPYLIQVGPGVYNESPITMKQWVYINGSGDQDTFIVCTVPTGKLINGIDNSGILNCNIGGTTGTGGIIVYHVGVGAYAPFLVKDCVFADGETLAQCHGATTLSLLQIETVRFGGAVNNFATGFVCTNAAPGVPAGLSLSNVTYLDIVPPTNTVFASSSGDGTSVVFSNSTIRITPTSGTTAFLVQDGGDLRLSSSYIRGFDYGIRSLNVGAAPSITAQAVVILDSGSYQLKIEHPGTTGHFFGSYIYPQVSIPDAAPFYIDGEDSHVINVAKKGGDFDSIADAADSISGSSITNRYTIMVHSGIYTEPLINLTAKPYVSITGLNIQSASIIPDGSHHAISVGIANEISFMTFQDVPAGYAGIAALDSGDYGQCHKVSFIDCDIGIKVTAVTQTTNFYAEYVDYNGVYSYGTYIEASSGQTAFANLENYYNLPVGATAPIGTYVSGTGADVVVLASGSYGEGVGTAFYIQDGANITTLSTDVYMFDKGFHVGNVGAASTFKIAASFSSNTTYDVQIEHPTASGSIGGSLDRAKLTSASSLITVSITDPNPASPAFVNTGEVIFGRTPATLVASLDLLQQGSAMGVYSGGVLSDGGGLVVDVSAGYGYMAPGGVLTRKDWSASNLTLATNSSLFIYFNGAGVLTSNVTEPSTMETILLGKVVTDASAITYIQRTPLQASLYSNQIDRMFREAIGPVFHSGCAVSESGTRNLDVASGEYYYSETEIKPSGGVAVSWTAYYRSGTPGVYTAVASQTVVDNAFWDDGSGTLAAIPTGQYAKPILYLIGDGAVERYALVYPQATYVTQLGAENGTLPVPPGFINDAFVRLASIVIQEGTSGTINIIDERPRIGFASSSTVGGVTDHGALSGLGDDDHTQYILVNGSRAFTGAQSFGGNNLTSVGTVNGVTVETHASRHLPTGADPLTTAAPTTSLSATTSNATGIQNSFSRSDHSHAILTGVVSTQTPNQANAAGTSANLARADHIHNIPTAIAVNVGAANSAGSAASFAASDHVHQGVHGLKVNSGTTRFGDINLADGTAITVTDGGAGTFTIATSAEANTASNVGSGADVFKQKTGVDLEFRGINAVALLGAVVNADNIDISLQSSTTANQILLSSGTVSTEPSWGALPLGNSSAVTGTLVVSNGGTGATSLTSGNVLVGAGTSAVTTTKAAPSGDFAGTSDAQILTNKTLVDVSTTISNSVDPTKLAKFSLSPLTTGTTRTLTVPDASGTLALTSSNLGAFASTTSVQLAGVISDETGTAGSLVFSGSPTLITPSISSIVNTGTLTLPTSTDTLVGLSTADTLANKSVVDASFSVIDDGDNTKKVQFQVSAVSTGTTRTLTVQNASGTLALTSNNLGAFGATTSAQLAGVISDETGTAGSLVFSGSPTLITPSISSIVNTGTLTLPTSTDTLVGLSTADTLANKSMVDATFTVVDNLDMTKKVQFQVAGVTTATTRTLTVPNASGTLALTSNNLGDFSSTTSAQLAGVISDETGTGSLVFSGSPNLVTPSIASIVNSGTLTLPTSTDTLVGLSTSDTLANKTLIDGSTAIANSGDLTKLVVFSAGGITTGTTRTLTVQDLDGTLALTNNNLGVFATTTSTQLANIISDKTGTAGSLVFSGSPNLVTPSIASIVNSGATLTLPTSTTTLVGLGTADTLTNKTLTSSLNNITASALFSAAGANTINVSSASTPTSGQVLTATSGTAATWQSTSSITSLGTVTTGTWQATPIAPAYGGTGLTSYTIGDLIYASGTTTLSKLNDVAVGNVLLSGGVGVAPSWGKVDLASAVSGVLPSANGGTGVNNGSNTITLGGNFVTSGSSSVTLTSTGTTSLTLPVSGTLLSTGSTYVASVTGTTNQITVTGTTNPTLTISTGYVGQTSITTLGTITTGTWNGTTVAVANGGTGITTAATPGAVVYGASSSALGYSAAGTAGQLLLSGGAGVPTWGQSYTAAATASTVVSRDSSANTAVNNLTANNVVFGYTSTATAAGTTVLTVDSTFQQFFTGTTTQTVTLPVASTLATGHRFVVTNQSTGAVTIQSSGANTVTNITQNQSAVITCVLNSGTTAASWYAEVVATSSVTSFSAGTTGFTPSSATTGGITLAGVLNAANGGTGVNNGSNTITLGGNMLTAGAFTTSGANPITLTTTGTTSLTLPTSGTLISTGSTYVASVIGTAGQITVAGTTNPTLSISGTYAGQSSIVTVGTLTSGATGAGFTVALGASTITGTLVAANGGTGQSSYTVGDLLYASGATALSKLADVATGNVLLSGGVGVAPSWGKVDLTTAVTGVLPSANGGTGVNNGSSIITLGGSFTTSGANPITLTTTGTTSITLPVSGTLLSTGSTYVASVTGTAGQITVSGTTNPTLSISASYVGQASITTLGTITSGTWNGTTIAVANGGTGITTAATPGAVVYGASSSALGYSAAGTAGQLLLSGGAGVPTWGQSYTAAATASTVVSRDASANTAVNNLTANNAILGYVSTVTAAGTTTLTVNSAAQQFFTGTTTQTVTLPVTSTLVTGQKYVVTNLSTGIVTIQSSGANTITTLAQNQTAKLTCILTSGTTAASWYVAVVASSAVTSFSAGSTGLTPNSATTGAVTLAGVLNAANGGTGVNNGANTITLGGNLTTGGAFTTSGASALTLTTTATTSVTLPSGTSTLIGTGSTYVASVTGTTNQITVTGTTNPTLSISGTYAGQSSIVTTGTLTSGATGAGFTVALGASTVTGALAVANGGTALTSYTAGDILYASGTTTLTKLAAGTVNQLLHSGTTPSWSAVSLTADVSGILPGANGGTGVNNGANTITLGGNLTTGGAFTTSGASALTLTTTGTTNVTFPSGTSTLIGTSSIASNAVTTFSAGTTGLTPNSATNGAVTLAGTLGVANGGTGATSLTSGALLVGAGTGAVTTVSYDAVGTTASNVVSRDANKNSVVNNLIEGYTTTATAAGTTTLVVGSTMQQYFTGSSTQTVTLPVVSTLVLGQSYSITNLSSGTVTVQSSGANTLVALKQNQTAVITCILTSGTGIASWFYTVSVGSVITKSWINLYRKTYSAGTSVSQSTTAVTGVGTTFVKEMVGGIIIYNSDNSTSAFITDFKSTTSLTVYQSQTVSSTSTYTIYYGGSHLDDTGNASFGLLYNTAIGDSDPFYSTGTVTQSGTTVTGSGTTFTQAMVGGLLTFPSATNAVPQFEFITAVNSGTSLTVTNSQTIGSASAFVIYYSGLQADTAGNVSALSFYTPSLSFVGATSGTTAMVATAAASGALTLPAATDTLVARSTADTLTNKVMTSSLNNITASGLFTGSGSGTVSISAATAPTLGQVLTATSGTVATWQTPSGGGSGTVTSVSAGTGLTLTGTATIAPTLSLTSPVSPTLGGTGLTSYAVGDIMYASATGTLAKLADVAAGSYLRSGGVTTAPVWSTLTLPNAATTGDVLYASGTNVISALADVATGNSLISGGVGTAPSWGKIGLTTHVSGILPLANGGTGSSTVYTQNSIIFAGASGVLSEDKTLTANGPALLWDKTSVVGSPRLVAIGNTGTNQLRVGDQFTDPDGGLATCSVYMEQTTTGAPDGMRTYFRGTTAATSGYITYSYDGTSPYIRLLDIDDDPSYITFQTARQGLSPAGTFAAPCYVNSFGTRGASAAALRGFSWRTNGGVSGNALYASLTEIMLLDDTALLIPVRTTANRPAGVSPAPAATNGMIGYNSTLQSFEGYENGSWTLTAGLMSGNTIYSTGTMTQSTTTLTGSGTTFTQAMVGGVVYVTSGANAGLRAFVTGFTSATVLTVTPSQTVAAGSSFSLYYGGSQSDKVGNVSFNQQCLVTDTNFAIIDGTDSSKRLKIDTSTATTATTLTLASTQSTSQTLSLPNITASDTLTSNALAQTLTNKTMTGTNNTLTASLLKSATTEVSVSAATAPVAGQVLTATSSTTATWQFGLPLAVSLSANATANSTTTLASITGLETTVGAGTYTFQYYIRYQSGATTTGVRFGVDHTGTTTMFMALHRYTSTATTTSTGAASMAAAGATGNMYEAQGVRTKNVIIGAPTVSVDSANSDMMSIVEGMMIVTVSGTMRLMHASEVAASSQVMAGTTLLLNQVA